MSSDNFEGFKQFGPGFHGILPIMILKIMLRLLSPKRKNVTHVVKLQFNLLRAGARTTKAYVKLT